MIMEQKCLFLIVNHHATNDANDIHIINEYNLTTPYDISTIIYATIVKDVH